MLAHLGSSHPEKNAREEIRLAAWPFPTELPTFFSVTSGVILFCTKASAIFMEIWRF